MSSEIVCEMGYITETITESVYVKFPNSILSETFESINNGLWGQWCELIYGNGKVVVVTALSSTAALKFVRKTDYTARHQWQRITL